MKLTTTTALLLTVVASALFLSGSVYADACCKSDCGMLYCECETRTGVKDCGKSVTCSATECSDPGKAKVSRAQWTSPGAFEDRSTKGAVGARDTATQDEMSHTDE